MIAKTQVLYLQWKQWCENVLDMYLKGGNQKKTWSFGGELLWKWLL